MSLIVLRPVCGLQVVIKQPHPNLQVGVGLSGTVVSPSDALVQAYSSGLPEFWAKIEGRTGCDEVLAAVRRALAEAGFEGADCEVRLTSYGEGA